MTTSLRARVERAIIKLGGHLPEALDDDTSIHLHLQLLRGSGLFAAYPAEGSFDDEPLRDVRLGLAGNIEYQGGRFELIAHADGGNTSVVVSDPAAANPPVYKVDSHALHQTGSSTFRIDPNEGIPRLLSTSLIGFLSKLKSTRPVRHAKKAKFETTVITVSDQSRQVIAARDAFVVCRWIFDNGSRTDELTVYRKTAAGDWACVATILVPEHMKKLAFDGTTLAVGGTTFVRLFRLDDAHVTELQAPVVFNEIASGEQALSGLAVAGDMLAIGVTSASGRPGEVLIARQRGGRFELSQRLVAPTEVGRMRAWFGSEIALTEHALAVTTQYAAVSLFRRIPGGEFTFVGAHPVRGGNVGSIALNDSTLVIGGRDSEGVVDVLEWREDAWCAAESLIAKGHHSSCNFGAHLELAGDRLLACSIERGVGVRPVLFRRKDKDEEWHLLAEFDASDRHASPELFERSIALGDTFVVQLDREKQQVLIHEGII